MHVSTVATIGRQPPRRQHSTDSLACPAPMPRPRKRRILSRSRRAAVFKPAGLALQDLRQVRLLAEELEALRLADLDGLTQAEAARRMGVSRSTFQRIVQHARRQAALALVETHALHIEGSQT